MKTMRLTAMALLAAVAGCASGAATPSSPVVAGPSDQDQEAALAIVWEGVYGMERESRPSVTWFFDCVPDRLNVVVTPECWGEQATPAHGVELQWIGPHISDSYFSKGLDAWHGFLMNGKFVEWDLVTIGKSQNALAAAGL